MYLRMKEKFTRCLPLLVALPLLVLATVNCGDSPAALCGRADTLLKAKVGTCSKTKIENDKAACEATVGECTADDRSKINTGLDCMDKLAACADGKELEFLASFGACSAQFENLSEKCKTAFAIKALAE